MIVNSESGRQPCDFCQNNPENSFICLLVTCVFTCLLLVKAVNFIYLSLEISYKMNKKHSSCSFQNEWLSDDFFRAWISKTGNKKEACCVVCKRNVDISAMESSAFYSHASGTKHKELMIAHNHNKCGSISLFFNKSCSSGRTKAQHKTGTMKEMLTKNHVTNAEIMWCLKVVDRHFS